MWDQYQNDPLRVAGATAGLGNELFIAMENTNKNLSNLSIPTLVQHGEIDRIVPVHFSEPFEKLPNVTRKVLPGLEHEILNENSWKDTLETYIAFARGVLGIADN